MPTGSTGDVLRGERSEQQSQGIDVLDENWNTVAVYQQCGWTLTPLTIAGEKGMPIIAPHYVGITAGEIEASCRLLCIPRVERTVVALGIRIMVNTAAPLLNKRSRG